MRRVRYLERGQENQQEQIVKKINLKDALAATPVWALVFPNGTIDPRWFYGSRKEMRELAPGELFGDTSTWERAEREGYRSRKVFLTREAPTPAQTPAASADAMGAIFKIGEAIKALRKRTKDKQFGSRVEQGRFQLVRTTYAGKSTTIEELSGWMKVEKFLPFLESWSPTVAQREGQANARTRPTDTEMLDYLQKHGGSLARPRPATWVFTPKRQGRHVTTPSGRSVREVMALVIKNKVK